MRITTYQENAKMLSEAHRVKPSEEKGLANHSVSAEVDKAHCKAITPIA